MPLAIALNDRKEAGAQQSFIRCAENDWNGSNSHLPSAYSRRPVSLADWCRAAIDFDAALVWGQPRRAAEEAACAGWSEDQPPADVNLEIVFDPRRNSPTEKCRGWRPQSLVHLSARHGAVVIRRALGAPTTSSALPAANPMMQLHDRQPAILDPSARCLARPVDLLNRNLDGALKCHGVSRAVSSTKDRSDSADMIEPLNPL
jgi:hypothetical protein